MKNLAELKRAIKVGTRLLCVENTHRPILNGRIRVVEKAQGNSFAWRHDPQPEHSLIIKSLRDLQAECACGDWHYVAPTFDSDTDCSLTDRAREQYGYHEHSAKARSWTSYEKAAAFTFDGSDTFTMEMAPGKSVTLTVLA